MAPFIRISKLFRDFFFFFSFSVRFLDVEPRYSDDSST